MAAKIFPGGVIRGYSLGVNIHTSSDDEEFYLCFGNDGTMYVQIFLSPNKMYSKGDWSGRILPADFDKHTVDGKKLRDVVAEKLRLILPEGAETNF